MRATSPFTRRRFLTSTLASTVAIATTLELQRAARALGFAANAEVCKLMAEQEVGPYYVPDEMLRSNITEGKPGVPLTLRIAILDARTCKPLQDAAIDIWHCDALGVYSGYTKQSLMGPGMGPNGPGGPPPGFDPAHPENRPGPPLGPPPGGPGGPGGPPENQPTDKLTFCRGIQMTGADGSVSFQTVFPGFYMGRTNHIHFKVRIGGHAQGKSYAAGHASHIGQVFFPEEFSAKLMMQEPYSKHKIHRTTQAEDDVFNDQHGDLSVARLTPATSGAGYSAELLAAVDPTATPAPAQRAGGPGGPGGPPPGN
jgi:protocatechuate 3,4-dioxygenase beta subunit